MPTASARRSGQPGLDTAISTDLPRIDASDLHERREAVRRWRAEQVARGGQIIGGVWFYPGDREFDEKRSYEEFDRRLLRIIEQECKLPMSLESFP